MRRALRAAAASLAQGAPTTAHGAVAFPAPPTLRWGPARLLHATPRLSAAAAVEVRLPPLGESISEGAVAAVLVKPGDAVAEDAVVAQIETDKVTVDVRAPSAGVVAAVLVAEGDSVVVGQLVVVLDAEAAGSGAVVAALRAAAVEAAAPAPAAAPAAPAVAATTIAPARHAAHRTPAIRFPRRVTAAGVRVSTLAPAAQAAARSSGDVDDGDLLIRLSGGRLYVGREKGTKLSRSRVLTDAEIEQIELGGAV